MEKRKGSKGVAVPASGSAAPASVMDAPPESVTLADLGAYWQRFKKPQDVVEFKGKVEREAGTDLRCFSNFYDEAPFDFVLPPALFRAGGMEVDPTPISCQFSEKAIMLCKAAVFGDAETYAQVLEAAEPAEAKALGKEVSGFDAERWQTFVCLVAYEVVYQKFSKLPALQPTLLGTGDAFIVEATRADAVWGIGLDKGDGKCRSPASWRGTNILGWALMRARAAIRAKSS